MALQVGLGRRGADRSGLPVTAEAPRTAVLLAGSLLYGIATASWLGLAPALPWAWLLAVPTGALCASAAVLLIDLAHLARASLGLLALGSALFWSGLDAAALAAPLLGLGSWVLVLVLDGAAHPTARKPLRFALLASAFALGAALSSWLQAWPGTRALTGLLGWALPSAALAWMLVPAAPTPARETGTAPTGASGWRLLPVALLAAPLCLLPWLWVPVDMARVTTLPPDALKHLQWLSWLILPPLLLSAALVQRWLGARWLLRLMLLASAVVLPWQSAALRAAAQPELAAFRSEVPVALVTADCVAQSPCLQVYEHLLALGLDVELRVEPVDAPWLELDGQAVDLPSLEWVSNALNSFNFPTRAARPDRIALFSAWAWFAFLSTWLFLPMLSLVAASTRTGSVTVAMLVGVSVLPMLAGLLARPLALQTGQAGAAVLAWSGLALLALLCSFLVSAPPPRPSTD